MNNRLIRKHAKRLVEVTVKSHVRHSKKGKAFNVKQHEREASLISQIQDVVGKPTTYPGGMQFRIPSEYRFPEVIKAVRELQANHGWDAYYQNTDLFISVKRKQS
jgi:hypothetical protein